MSFLKGQHAQFLRDQARLQARNVADAAASARVKSEPASGSGKSSGSGGTSKDGKAAKISGPLDGLQATNWLKDADKYAAVLGVRNLPLAQKIKKVIDLLFKERQGLTANEVESMTYVDLPASKELQDALRTNPKIRIDGEKYFYKAKHDLKGKDELLRLVREHKDGIPFADVKDSYSSVDAHAQELKAEGSIWLLAAGEGMEVVLYPNDPKIQIRVDDDVRAMVRSVELPRDLLDLERDLQRSGHRPAASTIRRLRELEGAALQLQKPKQKKRRESKRTKYTNSHLPEFFKDNPMP